LRLHGVRRSAGRSPCGGVSVPDLPADETVLAAAGDVLVTLALDEWDVPHIIARHRLQERAGSPIVTTGLPRVR